MWKALAVVVALGRVASADDSLLDGETRVARDAAASGHCEIALEYGHKIAVDAPEYYARTWVTDPSLARCMAPPPPVAEAPQAEAHVLPEIQPPPPQGEPPFSGGRVAAQILVGTAVGAATGILIGKPIGEGLSKPSFEEEESFVGPLVGGALGYTLGAAVGVYVMGRTADVDASFGMTLAGSTLGMAVAGLFASDLLRNGNKGAVAPAVGLMVVAPLGGSLAGFHLTRKWRDVRVVPVSTHNTVGIAGTF